MAIINSIISGGGTPIGGISENEKFMSTVDVKVPLSDLFVTFPTNTSQTTVISLTTTRFSVSQAEYDSYVWGIRTRFNVTFKLKDSVADFAGTPIFCFGANEIWDSLTYGLSYGASSQSNNSTNYNYVTSHTLYHSSSSWGLSIDSKCGYGYNYSSDGSDKRCAYIAGILGFVYAQPSSSNRPQYNTSYQRIDNVPTNCPLKFCANATYFDPNKVDGIDMTKSYLHYVIDYYKLEPNKFFSTLTTYNTNIDMLRTDLQ